MKIALPFGFIAASILFYIINLIKSLINDDNEAFAYGTFALIIIVAWSVIACAILYFSYTIFNIKIDKSFNELIRATLMDGVVNGIFMLSLNVYLSKKLFAFPSFSLHLGVVLIFGFISWRIIYALMNKV